MSSDRIRQRILADHAYLRILLDEVDRRAFRVKEGRTEEVQALRARGLELLGCLREHLALEDRCLAPALARSGGAGDQRAGQLAREHAEQRELLDYILVELRDGSRPARVLAEELRSLVELLLDDMAYEELTILQELGAAPTVHPQPRLRPRRRSGPAAPAPPHRTG